MMKNDTLLILCLLLSLTSVHAATLTEQRGNLYYNEQQLSNLGKDSQASLSPDGKQLVFIREMDNKDTELWLMDVTGQNARALVQTHEQEQKHEDIKQSLRELNNPLFSLDGKSVYFLSAAWAVSNAVHLLDLASNKQRFVTDGNSLQLVPAGKYRGYPIVSQHRYHKHGGSYEAFWLISPKGKAIKYLGEQQEQVDAFIRASNSH
jgi:Tol biopolymer transport system component